MQVWNMLHAARWKDRTQKITIWAISLQLRHISTIGKKLVRQQNLPHMSSQYGSVVWGTPANFNGFRVLAALLHGTLVVGVSQTLRRRTDGATYIRQGGHHVGHWPTFLVCIYCAVKHTLNCWGELCNFVDENGLCCHTVKWIQVVSWWWPRCTRRHCVYRLTDAVVRAEFIDVWYYFVVSRLWIFV